MGLLFFIYFLGPLVFPLCFASQGNSSSVDEAVISGDIEALLTSEELSLLAGAVQAGEGAEAGYSSTVHRSAEISHSLRRFSVDEYYNEYAPGGSTGPGFSDDGTYSAALQVYLLHRSNPLSLAAARAGARQLHHQRAGTGNNAVVYPGLLPPPKDVGDVAWSLARRAQALHRHYYYSHNLNQQLGGNYNNGNMHGGATAISMYLQQQAIRRALSGRPAAPVASSPASPFRVPNPLPLLHRTRAAPLMFLMNHLSNTKTSLLHDLDQLMDVSFLDRPSSPPLDDLRKVLRKLNSGLRRKPKLNRRIKVRSYQHYRDAVTGAIPVDTQPSLVDELSHSRLFEFNRSGSLFSASDVDNEVLSNANDAATVPAHLRNNRAWGLIHKVIVEIVNSFHSKQMNRSIILAIDKNYDESVNALKRWISPGNSVTGRSPVGSSGAGALSWQQELIPSIMHALLLIFSLNNYIIGRGRASQLSVLIDLYLEQAAQRYRDVRCDRQRRVTGNDDAVAGGRISREYPYHTICTRDGFDIFITPGRGVSLPPSQIIALNNPVPLSAGKQRKSVISLAEPPPGSHLWLAEAHRKYQQRVANKYYPSRYIDELLMPRGSGARNRAEGRAAINRLLSPLPQLALSLGAFEPDDKSPTDEIGGDMPIGPQFNPPVVLRRGLAGIYITNLYHGSSNNNTVWELGDRLARPVALSARYYQHLDENAPEGGTSGTSKLHYTFRYYNLKQLLTSNTYNNAIIESAHLAAQYYKDNNNTNNSNNGTAFSHYSFQFLLGNTNPQYIPLRGPFYIGTSGSHISFYNLQKFRYPARNTAMDQQDDDLKYYYYYTHHTLTDEDLKAYRTNLDSITGIGISPDQKHLKSFSKYVNDWIYLENRHPQDDPFIESISGPEAERRQMPIALARMQRGPELTSGDAQPKEDYADTVFHRATYVSRLSSLGTAISGLTAGRESREAVTGTYEEAGSPIIEPASYPLSYYYDGHPGPFERDPDIIVRNDNIPRHDADADLKASHGSDIRDTDDYYYYMSVLDPTSPRYKRLLCNTYTYHKKMNSAIAMHQAWSSQCDHHNIFTDKGIPDPGATGLDSVLAATSPPSDSGDPALRTDQHPSSNAAGKRLDNKQFNQDEARTPRLALLLSQSTGNIVAKDTPLGEDYYNMWQKTRMISGDSAAMVAGRWRGPNQQGINKNINTLTQAMLRPGGYQRANESAKGIFTWSEQKTPELPELLRSNSSGYNNYFYYNPDSSTQALMASAVSAMTAAKADMEGGDYAAYMRYYPAGEEAAAGYDYIFLSGDDVCGTTPHIRSLLADIDDIFSVSGDSDRYQYRSDVTGQPHPTPLHSATSPSAALTILINTGYQLRSFISGSATVNSDTTLLSYAQGGYYDCSSNAKTFAEDVLFSTCVSHLNRDNNDQGFSHLSRETNLGGGGIPRNANNIDGEDLFTCASYQYITGQTHNPLGTHWLGEMKAKPTPRGGGIIGITGVGQHYCGMPEGGFKANRLSYKDNYYSL